MDPRPAALLLVFAAGLVLASACATETGAERSRGAMQLACAALPWRVAREADPCWQAGAIIALEGAPRRGWRIAPKQAAHPPLIPLPAIGGEEFRDGREVSATARERLGWW